MKYGRTAAKPEMRLTAVFIEENERWRMRADGRLVPLAGIEPALLAELDFESSASTSSATGAFRPRAQGAGDAKPAEYSGRSVPVNPRGCDIAAPRQEKSRALPRHKHEEMNVTLAAATPSQQGIASNPAVLAALAIAVIAAATLAGAWFFQLVLDITPCPLCLEQRYAYYLALPLAAFIALFASRGAPRPVLVA